MAGVGSFGDGKQQANNMQIKQDKVEAYKAYVAKNSDPYGKGVVDYAERWADLMEKELAAGKTIEDIAGSTRRTADIDGIPVFMYGCAVSSLAHFWEFGEALRKWHNLEIQERANASGGTLNPALLTITD